MVLRRAVAEAGVELERFLAPRRGRRPVALPLSWDDVLARPFPFVRDEALEIERRWPEERPRILRDAERALAREVDVLGTGPVRLGDPIDWHCDWKTGRRWPLRYGRRLEYAELDRPSDVKVPWEISRAQWLLPAGQAYLLTGDETYAAGVRDVLDDWLRGNPYALGVNWAIAMEAALRVFSWSWLLYACGQSEAWSDAGFRARFLQSLWLHVDFVERSIERSDVNGNHYTADAAALVLGGLVLGVGRWADSGWEILEQELPRQVHPDGVDFEASSAYHRLVGELFALPALLRRAHGLAVGDAYVERVRSMARFTLAYAGPDGLAPLWGDNDDGRALPLGGQDVNDHRSLPVLAAALAGEAAPGNVEGAWLVGPAHVAETAPSQGSVAFPEGGAYILQSGVDHIFVDCGPVGLAGRGGHGHNDCLSFEATLTGRKLFTDSGSYVYTASAAERNWFRGTAAHNTPQVDGEEQNRIPESLWQLADDAKPYALLVEDFRFRGAHSGYDRLGVRPIRTIALDPELHVLVVHDEFEADGVHRFEVPFHLAPDVDGFEIRFRGPWERSVEDAWVSPSYGVRVRTNKLVFRRTGSAESLTVVAAPAGVSEDVVWSVAERLLS